MRFEGNIKSWEDDRGFGFIEPKHGGENVFVHVKAFTQRTGRPQIGQLVSFEVELGPRGKKRATRVEPLRRSRAPRVRRKESSAPWGTATLFAIPGFVLLYLVVAVLWRPPAALAGIYLAASVATFLAYAVDKSAAQRGRWRTSEGALHVFAMVGGWPGALIAQQFLRHKSAKAAFRSVFWGTVVINVMGFIVLCSPIGRPLWAP